MNKNYLSPDLHVVQMDAENLILCSSNSATGTAEGKNFILDDLYGEDFWQ